MPALPPPDVAAAAAVVDRWIKDGEEQAARAANPQPSAIDRFNAIRAEQYRAAAEGRTYVVPPAPVAVAPVIDPNDFSRRWGAWRK